MLVTTTAGRARTAPGTPTGRDRVPPHIMLSIFMAIVLGAAMLVLGASLFVAVFLAAIGSTAGVLIGRAVPPPDHDEVPRRPYRPEARLTAHPDANRSPSGT
jgi:hypothetical protein